MVSIDDKMRMSSYRPSGFDYMRFVLASAVIAQHTVNVCYGQAAAIDLFHSPYRGFVAAIVPMFFSLSGFLVAGSLERNKSLITFLGLRILRLLPALAFEVLLSAIAIGLLFTKLSPPEYLADARFCAYFKNIVGDIHYTLPAVFSDNPDPDIVNGQLWTLPSELACYIILALLSVLGIAGRHKLLILAAVAAQILLVFYLFQRQSLDITVTPKAVLVVCFIVSVAFYRMRAHIRISRYHALVAFIVSAALFYIPHGVWFLPLPLSYVTIYLGVQNPTRTIVISGGDYSYGIYLYGFPIQQSVVAFGWSPEWWNNFALSYPIAVLLAVISWHCVERPAMKLKSVLYAFEDYCMKWHLLVWHSRRVFLLGNVDEGSYRPDGRGLR